MSPPKFQGEGRWALILGRGWQGTEEALWARSATAGRSTPSPSHLRVQPGGVPGGPCQSSEHSSRCAAALSAQPVLGRGICRQILSVHSPHPLTPLRAIHTRAFCGGGEYSSLTWGQDSPSHLPRKQVRNYSSGHSYSPSLKRRNPCPQGASSLRRGTTTDKQNGQAPTLSPPRSLKGS